MTQEHIDQLCSQVRACTLCADRLKDGVRPVVQMGHNARVLIVGQAPGAKVHASGIPFDDASGDRLRDWMGVDKSTFYDPQKTAILPMGFCYPGTGKSGDLPPLKICAETWRQRLLDSLTNVQLTLVVGQYAQAWHLSGNQNGVEGCNEIPAAKKNLTETVKSWGDYYRASEQQLLPLPHPSPRNNIWLKKNPWFETDVLPTLKQRVASLRLV